MLNDQSKKAARSTEETDAALDAAQKKKDELVKGIVCEVLVTLNSENKRDGDDQAEDEIADMIDIEEI